MLFLKEKRIMDKVKEGYDNYAIDFDKSRQGLVWPQLKEILATVKPGSNILDLGCGNGRIIPFLPPNSKYLGVDNSSRLVTLAKDNFPKFEFMIGDMVSLSSIAERKFDYILCIAAWHHLPSQRLRLKALQEMKAKLQVEGKIIISVWDLWHNKKLRFKTILSLFSLNPKDVFFSGFKNGDYRYYHAFTKNEIKRLARKADLKIENFWIADGNYYFILSTK